MRGKRLETMKKTGRFRTGALCLFLISLLLTMSCAEPPETNTMDSVKSGNTTPVAHEARKKVLLVNSYHQGYFWTDGITEAVLESFGAGVDTHGAVDNSKSKVILNIIYMDTKRNPSEAYKKKAATGVKERIDSWQPDLIITTDDNAAKYLIVPYFKHTDLPVVFCGVNWDASNYGFPARNVTGMIEVQLVDQIIKTLGAYARGDRIGFIKGDDFSARKEAKFFEQRFNIKLINRFVKNFTQWQHQYRLLQDDADIVLVGNAASIPDWDANQARALINEITRVPTGNWDESMKQFNLVTFATVPREQGEWSARTALEILNGTPPEDIPLATNKVARVYLNMSLARKLGIKFPIELIEHAILLKPE